MSLQTATLGWRVISRRNKLVFSIPYVCNIAIGMDFSELNKIIKNNSKIEISVNNDSKNFHKFHYMDESGNIIMSVYIIGDAIHRIYYKGISNMIPSSMIYTVGKKNFVTDIRIDGYMLAIKDENEIWLKEVPSVMATDISSDSLGVTKKAFTKRDAESSSKDWLGVFNTRSIYTDEMYKLGQSEISKLEQEYMKLINKESELEARKNEIVAKVDKRSLLDKAQKRLHVLSEIFDKAKLEYVRQVNKNIDKIQKLINLGKLSKNKSIITLNNNKDSNNTERCIDKDLDEAKEIVNSLKPYITKYEKSGENLDIAKQEFEEIEKQISQYMATYGYRTSLMELENINSELSKLRSKIAELKQKIYK